MIHLHCDNRQKQYNVVNVSTCYFVSWILGYFKSSCKLTLSIIQVPTIHFYSKQTLKPNSAPRSQCPRRFPKYNTPQRLFSIRNLSSHLWIPPTHFWEKDSRDIIFYICEPRLYDEKSGWYNTRDYVSTKFLNSCALENLQNRVW